MIRFAAVLLCLAMCAGLVGSQPSHPDRPPRPEHKPESRGMPAKLKEELALSDEQHARLMGIRVEYKRSEIEKKAHLETSLLDLMEMLKQDQVDRKKIDKKVREIGKIRTEMELSKIGALLDARSLLTSEQFHKFKKLELPMMALLGPREPRRHHQ